MAYDVEKTWTTEAGYLAVCIAIKGMHRCGYVGIPFGHPLYNVKYSQSTPLLKTGWDKAQKEPIGKKGIIDIFCASCQTDEENMCPSLVFDVHGGLTYSGCNDYPIKSHLWWFGFDCGHNGDGYFEGIMASCSSGPVRSVDYVISECESLAKQLKEVEAPQIESEGTLPLK